MQPFLARAPDVRARAFEQAATRRGWRPSSVEKDFWVCALLRELFALPHYGSHPTFKGGTSLSKAWSLIDRFSEDIDLTISRDALGFGANQSPNLEQSGNERKRRLDALKLACRNAVHTGIDPALRARLQALLPNDNWQLTSDVEDPDGQTLLFAYPLGAPAGTSSYVQPVVKLEFGARSDPWPVADREVTAIVAEEFPTLFHTRAATVRALLPERTFWEKVLLLHEERQRPPTKPRQPRMARHFHDVWQLIRAGIAERALADAHLFERVVAHRQVYFRQNWVDYGTMRRGTLDVTPRPEQLTEWRTDYLAMQGDMFLTAPPPFDEVLTAIALFLSRFNAQ